MTLRSSVDDGEKGQGQIPKAEKMVLGADKWGGDCQAVWDIKEEGEWRGEGRRERAEDESQNKGLVCQYQKGRWIQLAPASWEIFW